MTTNGSSDRRWRQLSVTTGVAGLLALALIVVSQLLMQIGGSEPPFDARAAEIARFFDTRAPLPYQVGSYLAIVAVVVNVWFVGGMWAVLKRAEGEPAWRSTIALGSGLVYLAATLGGGWDLAVFRTAEGVQPEVARFAFDMGNLGFASSWVAIASFAVAAGWVLVTARTLPRWTGWWAIVAGAVLLVARAFWTSWFWFFGYGLFWLWVAIVSLLLIGRRGPGPVATAGSGAEARTGAP